MGGNANADATAVGRERAGLLLGAAERQPLRLRLTRAFEGDRYTPVLAGTQRAQRLTIDVSFEATPY